MKHIKYFSLIVFLLINTSNIFSMASDDGEVDMTPFTKIMKDVNNTLKDAVQLAKDISLSAKKELSKCCTLRTSQRVIGCCSTSVGLSSIAWNGCFCSNIAATAVGCCCLDPYMTCKCVDAAEDFFCPEEGVVKKDAVALGKYDSPKRYTYTSCSKKLIKILSYINPWSYWRKHQQ